MSKLWERVEDQDFLLKKKSSNRRMLKGQVIAARDHFEQYLH